MAKKPLKVTDRRRQEKPGGAGFDTKDTNGAGPALAEIFNDRRTYQNGKGKRMTG